MTWSREERSEGLRNTVWGVRSETETPSPPRPSPAHCLEMAERPEGQGYFSSMHTPTGAGSSHLPCDRCVHPPVLNIRTQIPAPHEFLEHVRAAVLVVTGATAEIRTGLGEEVVSTGSRTQFTLGWSRETFVRLWPHGEVSRQASAMSQPTQPLSQHSQQAQVCWAISEPS